MDAETLKQHLGAGQAGTYILCLQLNRQSNIDIGRLGNFTFNAGYYYYVGSAFGPGGVAARCRHHIAVTQRPRWHIDYLRRFCILSGIVFNIEHKHLEHRWAQVLMQNEHYSLAMKGFGASDCRCTSHLFYSSTARNPDSELHRTARVFTPSFPLE